MTKEKHERHENDYYITPPGLAEWAVAQASTLVNTRKLKEGCKRAFLEPGCGEFAPFADAACDYFDEIHAIDVMKRPKDFVDDEINQTFNYDFTKWKARRKFDAIVGNPPFSLAVPFIEKGLELLEPDGVLVYLLRLNFLASKKRIEFFKDAPPSHITVLQKRPSFTGDGKTDGQEYAYFFWRGGADSTARHFSRVKKTTLDWWDNTDAKFHLPHLPESEE